MATRDLPHSVGDFCFGWVDQIRSEITLGKSQDQLIKEDVLDDDETVETKVEIKNLWPAFASGAGLFSDGYVNAGISTVLSCLKKIYGDEFTKSNAMNNIGSIGFVGTVVGQLSFG